MTSQHIQEIFEHRQLRTLNLGFIEELSDETFKLLPSCIQMDGRRLTSVKMSNIQKLNLCKSKITDSSIIRIASTIALVEIQLQWCKGITDTGIIALVQNCPKLRLLDLTACLVTDLAIDAIAERCSELQILDLSWCNSFSEHALLSLIAAYNREQESYTNDAESADSAFHSKVNGLEQLNLDWCLQLTDETIEALAKIKTLKSIHITGCLGVSAGAIDMLKSFGKTVIL